MAESLQSPASPTQPQSAAPKKPGGEPPESVLLVAYPKIIFLYPTLIAAVVAAIWTGFLTEPFAKEHNAASLLATVFLGIAGLNLVILAFDFPRTTSLTLFFFAAAVVMAIILLVKFKPELVPDVVRLLKRFHPVANATFYWSIAGILGGLFVVVFAVVRFDYWEVRPNELLHHHGFLSNLERLSAPNLRIDKEINDLFEYMLLRSGRLILQPSSERRAIVLDNVPFITQKEAAITRMLGALQVQVRPEQ